VVAPPLNENALVCEALVVSSLEEKTAKETPESIA